MIRRPPRSTQSRSSAASDVYKRQWLETPQRVAGGSLSSQPLESFTRARIRHDDGRHSALLDDPKVRRDRLEVEGFTVGLDLIPVEIAYEVDLPEVLVKRRGAQRVE